MGGPNSGRRPSEETMVKRMSEVHTPVGSDLHLPNYSGVKEEARKDSPADILVVVNHGATAGTARPADADIAFWIGSVEPTNANNNDVWVDTS